VPEIVEVTLTVAVVEMVLVLDGEALFVMVGVTLIVWVPVGTEEVEIVED